MTEINQNHLLVRIGNWSIVIQKKLELILGLILFLSLIIRISTNYSMSMYISLSISILSFLYFISSYADLDNQNKGRNIILINKISGWGCSVAMIGLLFKIESFPNSQTMLFVGFISTIVSLIAMIVINNKSQDFKIFKKRLINRLLIISVVAIIFYSIPTQKLAELNITDRIEHSDNE